MDLERIFREHQGPPVNIEGIVRSLGIELDKKASLDPEISGQIERLGNNKYKISTNGSDSYFRQRFTIAHELGHLLYHSHLIGDGVDDNRAYRSVADGKFYNRSITAREETEANRFAASLLMPKESVLSVWENSGRSLKDTAKKFQVSMQAMRIRLESLDVPSGSLEDSVEGQND